MRLPMVWSGYKSWVKCTRCQLPANSLPDELAASSRFGSGGAAMPILRQPRQHDDTQFEGQQEQGFDDAEQQRHFEEEFKDKVHVVLCCYLYSKADGYYGHEDAKGKAVYPVPQPARGFLLLGLYAPHARWLKGRPGFSGATPLIYEVAFLKFLKSKCRFLRESS
ncbi:hypothetical protein PVAP13_3NG290701 [Panicum virgatum]|uniref:Uncharacterized protein n=1 Tax=Panicum virgatum TaxID=38727 RepID=A0A8T0UDA2_PANVG|nr:hypothetical protein PVAP13_3NG290701 [Panicum virgatum]